MATAANFKLKCRCGSVFSVAREWVGKHGECKKCGVKFRIPASPTTAALTGGATEKAPAKKTTASSVATPCPSCGKDMGQGTLVCISCGYHTKTQKRLKSFDGNDANDENKEDAAFTAGLFLIPAALALMTFAWFWQSGVDGPTYLVWYFMLFVVVGVLLPLVRKFLWDVDMVNYAATLALAGVGAVRIFESVSAGKFKLIFLVIGIALSVAVFLATQTKRNQHRNSPFVDAFGSLVLWAYFVLFVSSAALMAMVFFTPLGQIVEMLGIFMLLFVLVSLFILADWLSDSPPGEKRMFGSDSGCSNCGSSCGSSCGGGCGGGCGGCGD